MSNRSEMTKLVKDLQKEGFSVTRTGSGHWMVRPPQGSGSVVMSFSPAKRGLSQTLKQLKALGYQS